MPFAVTWMDLEIITLSEVRERRLSYDIIHMWTQTLKMIQMNLQDRHRLKDIENKLMVAAKSLQSCPALCDPIDGSPPGSPVPGILQARTLEWVAISFSNE